MAVGAALATLVGGGVVALNGIGHAAVAVPWQQVDAGEKHTCGIYNGSLWCWGDNTYGQLGLGDTTDRYFPHRVMNNTDNWVKVSAGGHRTCALNSDEDIYCWGLNPTTANTGYESRPKKINGTGWTDLATGPRHSCAIYAGGWLYCWGSNTDGQLGLGHYNDVTKPTIVSQSTGWSGLSVGGRATCALRSIYLSCWGQTGLGDRQPQNTPSFIGAGYQSVTAGAVICGISTGEVLYCWGNDSHGAAGLPDVHGYVTEPMAVGPMTWNWLTADTGEAFWHACGIRTNGRGYCWGSNQGGQLGTGDRGFRDRPTEIYPDATYRWIDIAIGVQHTCGIRRNDNVMMCWGTSSDGALGLGTVTSTYEPREIRIA